MSKVKSPSEKKRFSLQRDRRNTYGENSKSSRKNIAKGKQRQHMDERRGVAQALDRLTRSDIDDDVASTVEANAKLRTSYSRWNGFKKKPDTPLGIVLARKKSTRLH